MPHCPPESVRHKILVIIYHMLKDNKPYQDLGGDYFDQLDAARIERQQDFSGGDFAFISSLNS